ncbi:MAG: hypothetical protein ACPGNT_08015 [Rhodospirillales bacterium]
MTASGKSAGALAQNHDKALVTIAIGDRYLADLKAHALPSWQAYADRHGYDILVLTELIDKSVDPKLKSIHWQKLLIGLLPEVKRYDRVVWIDGDIIINAERAPCVVKAADPARIGAIDEARHMESDDGRLSLYNRFTQLNYLMMKTHQPQSPEAVLARADLASYYRLMGLDPTGAAHLVNTGLLVYDPKKWAGWFTEVYAKYPKDFADFENTPLAYELSRQGVLDCLDPRFNQVWARAVAEHYPFLFARVGGPDYADLARDCVQAVFDRSWFLHFAGGSKNPVSKDAFRLVDWRAPDAAERLFPDLTGKEGAAISYLDLKDVVADMQGHAAPLQGKMFLY